MRHLARHGEDRVAEAALLSAVTPLVVQTAEEPGGPPRASSATSERSSPPVDRTSAAH